MTDLENKLLEEMDCLSDEVENYSHLRQVAKNQSKIAMNYAKRFAEWVGEQDYKCIKQGVFGNWYEGNRFIGNTQKLIQLFESQTSKAE